MSEYYQDNKEERQGYQAEYSKTEKGIMVKRLAESRRRARIAKGGSHTPVNLRPSCSCCNRRKSSKDPIKFMQQLN